MLFIVKVVEDGITYEYEYGCMEHAREHLAMEKMPAAIYKYDKGVETLIETR